MQTSKFHRHGQNRFNTVELVPSAVRPTVDSSHLWAGEHQGKTESVYRKLLT